MARFRYSKAFLTPVNPGKMKQCDLHYLNVTFEPTETVLKTSIIYR